MPARPGLIGNVLADSPHRKAHPNFDEWKAKKKAEKEAEKDARKKARKQEKRRKRKEERKAQKAAAVADAAAEEKKTMGKEVVGPTPTAPEGKNGKKSTGSLLCFCFAAPTEEPVETA